MFFLFVPWPQSALHLDSSLLLLMSGMPMHLHNVLVLSVSQTEVIFHTYMYASNHMHVSHNTGRMVYSFGKLLVTEHFHLKESL